MRAWLKSHHLLALFLATTFFLTALLYYDSFSSPFFQDDKLHFSLMHQGSLWDPVKDFPYYRPIPIKIFYSVGFFLGGYNPLPYHMVLFAAFLICLKTIFSLVKKLTNETLTGLKTTFFYATNISLFGVFYLLPASYVVLGAMFIFLAIRTYLVPGIKGFLLTLLFNFLAFGSSELSFVIPGLMFSVDFYQKKFQKARLVFFMLLSVIAFFVRKIIVGLPSNPDYQMKFGLTTISSIKWYLFRAINLPEGVKRDIGSTFWIVSVIFLLVLALATIGCLKSKRLNPRLIVFSGMWFIAGGLPYYLLPNHLSCIYIMVALFGPMLLLGKIFSEKYLFVAAALLYFSMSVLGLNFLRSTHWMILKNTGPIGQFKSL